ncbi:hypothetical protein [Streptomyces sp. SID13726]|uniref:hypothetical protein n=1 Tax=Streptomyces sp. SID13726 TaxID=2706058 RepID=UPI0013BAC0F1|nr:hypothetical protein [Streptomyces sp. SID13726]NEB05050.1 hypothetical protein [Streptomyces sp. SID13726]
MLQRVDPAPTLGVGREGCEVAEEWVEKLSNWLVSAGFEQVDKELDGPFGDVLIEFKGAACEVIVGREKLQWYVGIAPRGGDPVMLPKVWASLLDGTEPDAGNADPLERQLAFVYQRLGEVEEAVERDSEVGVKLLAVNRRLIRARLGLDPEVPRPGSP